MGNQFLVIWAALKKLPKNPIMNYEQLFSSVFSCFHGLKFRFKEKNLHCSVLTKKFVNIKKKEKKFLKFFFFWIPWVRVIRGSGGICFFLFVANTYTILCIGQGISLKSERNNLWFNPWFYCIHNQLCKPQYKVND